MNLTTTRLTMQDAKVDEFNQELESLFRQHWDRLCRLLYRITGDEEEAQDLVLETFVRLYRQPPAHHENLSGWLYRVATNLGFNALRASRRRKVYEGEAARQGSLHHSAPDPAEMAVQNLEKQQVRFALAGMKPRLARVLVLRYSELSYAEIALAEGVRAGSVGTLLRRAEAAFERSYQALEKQVEIDSKE